MKKFILASSSPRRKEILSMLGIPFEIQVGSTNETVDTSVGVYDIPKMLAERKALGVDIGNDEIVIGCDTVVICEGKIYGKPNTRENAIKMLEALSGKSHYVVSGICVRSYQKLFSDSVETRVDFKELTYDEIVKYVDKSKPFDKAGSYGIQETAGAFVTGIVGDYYNVVGLPLNRLCAILDKKFGINLLI